MKHIHRERKKERHFLYTIKPNPWQKWLDDWDIRPGKQHVFGYQTENVLQKRFFMENFDTSIPSKYIQF